MFHRMAPLLPTLLLGLVVSACGEDDRIRELEERVAQLEDENASLRKGIVPHDPASPAVPVNPGDAPAWGAEPGSPDEEVIEEPPPTELIRNLSEAGAQPPGGDAVSPAADDPPPPAAASGDAALVIYRAVIARDVEDRAPVGEATTFPASVGKVYCFSEVGPTPGAGETQLTHRWSLDGQSQGETRLRVAGDHWRTFSNRTVTDAKRGAWQVDLVDEHGNVLRTLEFVVE